MAFAVGCGQQTTLNKATFDGAGLGGDGIEGEAYLVEKPAGDERTLSAVAPPAGEPDWTWDLIAGQHYLVGQVSLWNDTETLWVEYVLLDDTEYDWYLTEAHLYIGLDKPKKPAPGKFPYKKEFDSEVDCYLFEVELDEDWHCDTVYVATHATIEADGAGSETAWGGQWNDGEPTYEFGWGKRWGGYFSFDLMPTIALPDFWIRYHASHYGAQSYWGIFFDRFLDDEDYAVNYLGNRWPGWCVDKEHTMYANRRYEVRLYSSYDPNMPAFAAHDNWDLINYLVTMRNEGTGLYDVNWASNANKNQFQNAIWYLRGDIARPGANTFAGRMIADAEAHGENFVPGQDGFYAIILYPKYDGPNDGQLIRAQMNIIELPGCAN